MSLKSPLGNTEKDESIVSSWDSSVKKPKRDRSRVFDEADETNNEGNAIATMNSYFKISDDDADESTEFVDKSAEFSFRKTATGKSQFQALALKKVRMEADKMSVRMMQLRIRKMMMIVMKIRIRVVEKKRMKKMMMTTTNIVIVILMMRKKTWLGKNGPRGQGILLELGYRRDSVGAPGWL